MTKARKIWWLVLLNIFRVSQKKKNVKLHYLELMKNIEQQVDDYTKC